MLDIKFIRENKEYVKENLKRRKDESIIELYEELLKVDETWRQKKTQTDNFRKEKNLLAQKINSLVKEGKKEEIKEYKEKAKKIAEETKKIEEELKTLEEKRRELLLRIPNILEEDVPYGESDEDNVVIKKWGEIKETQLKIPHGEWLEKHNQADFKRATKISGNGFYFLKNETALLNQALIRFAIEKLQKKGFELIEVPYMMRRKPYEGVTDLKDFEDVMYKIEDEDLYLIATSEHPIAAMYKDEILNGKQLPLKYTGLSINFRKEVGSHGIETKGLFRVHQFPKVEQFVFCRPEESKKIHEEILKNAEEIFQELKLPYRIVNICTGDIGIVASKKYDIEVYMPREKKYREVVSASNVLSYQAVRLNIKYEEKGKREYLHTLNSTAIATTRVIKAIIETYYDEKTDTVIIPEVLKKYMFGIERIGKKTE